jgi:hypothetical protein
MPSETGMRISIGAIQELVGTLDDSPGFDSSRESFRRFLHERVTDVGTVAALIEQSQYALGRQNHRALQDLVTLLGRFLGFTIAFGVYEPVAGSFRYDGHWKSRERTHIVIEVRTDQTVDQNFESLSRSLTALGASSRLVSSAPPLGLSVCLPSYSVISARALSARQPNDIRVVSIRSLLGFAQMVSAGRILHEEFLGLLTSGRVSQDMSLSLVARR